MDEATARLIAERGIWLSIQPFPDELADAFPPGTLLLLWCAKGRHFVLTGEISAAPADGTGSTIFV
jgi:hypothetical protein